MTTEEALLRTTMGGAPQSSNGRRAPQNDNGRDSSEFQREARAAERQWEGLLRVPTGGAGRRTTMGGECLSSHRHSEPLTVIPNGVRNLRSSFDGWFITTTTIVLACILDSSSCAPQNDREEALLRMTIRGGAPRNDDDRRAPARMTIEGREPAWQQGGRPPRRDDKGGGSRKISTGERGHLHFSPSANSYFWLLLLTSLA